MTVNPPDAPVDEGRLVDWNAVLRGSLIGLCVLGGVSVIVAILDRNLDSFNDSGWIYPLFVMILVGLRAGRLAGGPARSRRVPHQRRARRRGRVRAVDPRPHRHLAGARRAPRAPHRAQPRAAARAAVRPPGDRRRARHVRRVPRGSAPGRAASPTRGTRVVGWCAVASRPGGRGPGRREAGPVRGTSGLHRARCWVTPSRGDPQDSATESRPPMASGLRTRRTGKGETVR